MPRNVRTRKFFSLEEAREMILNDIDIEVDNVVLIPPENKGDVTDEEECDEGATLPSDVPGTVEIDYEPAETAASRYFELTLCQFYSVATPVLRQPQL